MAEWITCPGCGGDRFYVSLGTMLPCGRCHGAGRVDLEREEAERRREDERLRRQFEKAAAEVNDWLLPSTVRYAIHLDASSGEGQDRHNAPSDQPKETS